MGKLIPLTRPRLDSGVQPPADAASELHADYELLPVGALLFAFSLARVAYAVWRHERFDIESTVALGLLLGLPWLAWSLIQEKPGNTGT